MVGFSTKIGHIQNPKRGILYFNIPEAIYYLGVFCPSRPLVVRLSFGRPLPKTCALVVLSAKLFSQGIQYFRAHVVGSFLFCGNSVLDSSMHYFHSSLHVATTPLFHLQPPGPTGAASATTPGG